MLGPVVPADGLTVTLSAGSALFDDRYGLAARKPLKLKPMTTFPNDAPEAPERGTVLTLMLTLLCGGGILFFLILVSGGFFGYVLAAVVAIALVGYVHYRLWGQALTREVSGERAVQEEQERRLHPPRDERIRRF